MEPKESLKITINGQTYQSLDEVPEQYRELIQAQMKSAMDQAAGNPKVNISIKKTFRIGGKIDPTSPQADPLSPSQPSLLTFLQTVIPWICLAFLGYMILRHWR